ncbi:hypothetical protein ABK040_003413 [Willaertia magna]
MEEHALNGKWLSKVDTDSISVILSFLPLHDQLQFRCVSKSFNEMITERITISKIVFDFMNYWNNKIKQNNLVTKNQILDWTMGAQLKINRFIRNQQILNKKEINSEFNENQLKLLQNGKIEVIEMINDKALCNDTVFSFCKIKWFINNNNQNEKEPKTITFVQYYLQCKDCGNLELTKHYVLRFYKDDNIDDLKTLAFLNNISSESFVTKERLEKLKSKFCNELMNANNYEEFFNFLLKLANCKQTVESIMDNVYNFKLSDIYSAFKGDEEDINDNYNQYHVKGSKEMEQFIFKYDWKQYLSIFCNSLYEIIHQMKSIALNNSNIKDLYEEDSSDEEEEEEISPKEKNLIKLIQSKLFKICDSKQEDGENNFDFKLFNGCEEFKENREAIFYLSNSNKYIKIKAVMKSMTLKRKRNATQLQLFYKELNENDWDCFYENDNLHFEQNIKEIYYEKERKRRENRPKRPMTAYFLFVKDKREPLKQQYPEKKMMEIAKELGTLWKSLSDEEKRPYVEQADELRKKYQKQLEEYKESDSETEENEERVCKKEKLGVMNISKVKEIFELDQVSDKLFIKKLIEVMKVYRFAVDSDNLFVQYDVQNNEIVI